MHRAVAALLALALAVTGCGSGAGADRPLARGPLPPAVPPTATPTTTEVATTTAPPGPTAPPAIDWPALPTDGEARAVVTPTGVVAPVMGRQGDAYVVQTPCANQAVVTGTPLTGAHVVLDPGHGGDEPGAIGPGGLTEKEVNAAVAAEAKRLLEEAGATVVLTRTADYRITLGSRALIATSLQPLAFISIHHNAEPDGPWPRPGSETYYQIASPESRRLAGLLWEEEVAALAVFDVGWVADTDAGAKYRANTAGDDFYGVLRRSQGVAGVLSEAAFISNPAEEALMRTPEFQRAEATAITRAVVRFVATDDPGSGFVEPYPRESPVGPGGGPSGCIDPPLG